MGYALNPGSKQTQGVGVGRAGVMGPHLHFGGFYGRGGGVGSRDEFVVHKPDSLHPKTKSLKPTRLSRKPEP